MSEHQIVGAPQKEAVAPRRVPEVSRRAKDGTAQEVAALLSQGASATPRIASYNAIMALQRTIGNKAVGRLLRQYHQQVPLLAASSTSAGGTVIARQDAGVGDAGVSTAPAPAAAGAAPAGAPSFTNSTIQGIYTAAAASLSPGQVAGLQSLDASRTGVWANLTWSTIAASAADRVVHPSHINQAVLGVCGSAAAVEAEAATNAKGYADEVVQLFTAGVIGGRKASTDLLNATPASGMDVCDWMMLSASQDTSNAILDFEGQPNESFSQGDSDSEEEGNLKRIDGCVKTTTISCSMFGEAAATNKVSNLMSAYGDNVIVVVGCDSGMLQGKSGAVDGTGDRSCHVSADHFVRLLSMSYSDLVQFKIYTWGQEVSLSWDANRYNKWVYEYVVGAKQASIALK